MENSGACSLPYHSLSQDTHRSNKQRPLGIAGSVDDVAVDELVGGQVKGKQLWRTVLRVAYLACIHHP